MTITPFVYRRRGPSVYNDLSGASFGRVTAGVTNAFQLLWPTTSDYACIIDRITMRSMGGTNVVGEVPQASNHTMTLSINGTDLPFQFPGSAARIETGTLTWNLNGCLVVPPGTTAIRAKSDISILGAGVGGGSVWCQYRRVNPLDAVTQGLWDGLPTLTATNPVLMSGTPNTLVSATAGKSVHIKALSITGHTFQNTSQDVLLEFSDFGANHKKIYRCNVRGVDPAFAPQMMLGDLPIRGPVGYGVRITATGAQIITGVTVNIVYTLVGAHETWDPFGVPGSASDGTSKKYFWFYSESTAAGQEPLFPTTSSLNNTVATIEGCALNSITVNPLASLGIGATSGGVPFCMPLQMLSLDDADGAGTAVGRHLVNECIEVKTNIGAVVPAFERIQALGAPSASAALVWGRLSSNEIPTKKNHLTGV